MARKANRRDVHRGLVEFFDANDRPPTIEELHALVTSRGVVVSTSGVTHHLGMLLRDGSVRADGSGRYTRWLPVTYPDGSPWLSRAELLRALNANTNPGETNP